MIHPWIIPPEQLLAAAAAERSHRFDEVKFEFKI